MSLLMAQEFAEARMAEQHRTAARRRRAARFRVRPRRARALRRVLSWRPGAVTSGSGTCEGGESVPALPGSARH